MKAASLLLQSVVFMVSAATADKLDAEVEAVINIINEDPNTCINETAVLRECMQSSGDALECTKCMIDGLDSTKPITCDELEVGGVYCRGVEECVTMKCKEDCREEYYDGLNCAIQHSCSDVALCSPQYFDEGVQKVAR